jgi:hypothetical protein
MESEIINIIISQSELFGNQLYRFTLRKGSKILQMVDRNPNRLVLVVQSPRDKKVTSDPLEKPNEYQDWIMKACRSDEMSAVGIGYWTYLHTFTTDNGNIYNVVTNFVPTRPSYHITEIDQV